MVLFIAMGKVGVGVGREEINLVINRMMGYRWVLISIRLIFNFGF